MIEVYRGKDRVETLRLTREMTFSHSLMGEHKITVSGYRTPRILNVQIGDHITYKGIEYTINTVPEYSKIEHSTDHEYNFTFEAPLYKLFDKILMFEGDSLIPGFGTPSYYIDLILTNINEIDGGWLKGQVDEADEQHITLEDVSCRVALTTIAEKFGMEWHVENKRIHLVAKVGKDRDITVQHGRGKGLYNISRSYVEDKNVVTRVFATGGGRNLPEGYTKNRLQLAEPLEANIELYGVKEGIYANEDIFPTRTGTVTSVTPHNPETKFNKLVDTGLDFNIKDHLAPGLTAKIGFQSGELAGYEFEITEYDHSTKTITYLTNTDTSTGLIMPSENFQAKPGDKYKLLDIYLPKSYVDAAMAKLKEEAEEYLEESKFPRVAYDLNIDVLHFKRNGFVIEPGDRIRVVDTDISLDTLIRVTSVTYPLAFYLDGTLWNGMSYEVELANDFIPYTVQERIQIEQREQKKEIKEQNRLSKHTQAALEEIARAAAINQFERTYVGQLAILTGALIVGNPVLGQTAFVSGLGGEETDLRFGAGGTIDNPESNKFRVNHAGKMWATDADISGIIKALSGKIGNWEITKDGLVNSQNYFPDPTEPDPNGEAVFVARKYFRDIGGAVTGEASSLIGAQVLSATTGSRAVGSFTNSEPNAASTNYGVFVNVTGGKNNTAIKASGSILNNGYNGGYNLYQFTPNVNGAGNVIDPKYGNYVTVYLTDPSQITVFFPHENIIQELLGVNSGADYSINITVTNQFNSTQVVRLRHPEGQKIRLRSAGVSVSVDYVNISPSETSFFQIIKSGSEKWVQMLTRDLG